MKEAELVTTEEMMQIIADAFEEQDIAAGDIPGIDLYMDQITTLFDERLAVNRRTPEEKLITKTMINNYSKDGLLQRISGKKYTKEHMLMMLLIYNLKQGLSIQDIGRVVEGLAPVLTNGKEGYNPQQVLCLYNSMLELKETQRNLLPGITSQMPQQMADKDEQLQAALAVVALTSLSNLCRRAAERLIDNSFPLKKK